MHSAFKSLLRSKTGTIGAAVLILFVFAALTADWLPLWSPIQASLRERMVAPTLSLAGLGSHPLGTDQLGRDMLSRIIFGSRVTLAIGSLAVIIGGLVGVTIGLFAGYMGGLWDRIFMRLADMQLALPLMLLAIIVVAALGPSLQNLVIVLAIATWTRYARIVRGQVLALREREFVQSARAIGAGTLRVMFRHILPNVLTPILVVATLELARVIIMEAALSFLGLGVQPPFPSWGRMLAEGRTYMQTGWWMAAFPGLAILFTVLAISLLGDWLRDYFDPKLR